jgi:hypothetical protein
MEFGLKRDYRIEPIAESGVGREAAVDLWVREEALSPERAQRRAEEVCLVGTTPARELCGISTAYLARNAQLRLELWHIRAFVAEAHRAGNLATQLLWQTRIHLNDRFVSGQDTRAPGAIIEVENEALKRLFPEVLWQPTMFTYVGNNARGDHCRVHWFEGALLPPPPPPPAAG